MTPRGEEPSGEPAGGGDITLATSGDTTNGTAIAEVPITTVPAGDNNVPMDGVVSSAVASEGIVSELLPWSVYLTLLNRDGSDSSSCFLFRKPAAILFGRYVKRKRAWV